MMVGTFTARTLRRSSEAFADLWLEFLKDTRVAETERPLRLPRTDPQRGRPRELRLRTAEVPSTLGLVRIEERLERNDRRRIVVPLTRAGREYQRAHARDECFGTAHDALLRRLCRERGADRGVRLPFGETVLGDADRELKEFIVCQREVVVVRAKERVQQHDSRSLIAIAERMVRDHRPEEARHLSCEIGIIVGGNVVRSRQRRLEQVLVQDRVRRRAGRRLRRFGVRDQGCVTVRIFEGQFITAARIRRVALGPIACHGRTSGSPSPSWS